MRKSRLLRTLTVTAALLGLIGLSSTIVASAIPVQGWVLKNRAGFEPCLQLNAGTGVLITTGCVAQTDASGQGWGFRPKGPLDSGLYALYSTLDSRCVDNDGMSTVFMSPCDSRPSQVWELLREDIGLYGRQWMNTVSGKCMADDPTTHVVSAVTCAYDYHQAWTYYSGTVGG
ncbi:hypothetical protein ACFQ1S_17915 [Kibdelosporangium lantanae]|uniref:Ricin B lectin domain-containing protein n=1 Tax=Kibdelosporangium lantanae TaxID=1497396 RepID=A0ABW3MDJ6_9PSEU